MIKAKVTSIGSFYKEDGRPVVDGWSFDATGRGGWVHSDAFPDYVAGWHWMELETIHRVKEQFGYDAALSLAQQVAP